MPTRTDGDISDSPNRENPSWRKRLRLEVGNKRIREQRTGRGWRHYCNIPAIKRVVLLKGLGALGLLGRARACAENLEIRELTLTLDRLPSQLSGLRILHLSDFHFDGRPDFVDKVCALVRRVEFDLCAMTGDYDLDYQLPTEGVVADLTRIVEHIQCAHGVFATLGNHDESGLIEPMRRMGVQVLMNENRYCNVGDELFCLLGVDDPHDYRCDDLQAALENVPDNAFKILLAHSPELIDEARDEGVHLYLCGHTHGGQIRLPGVGAVYNSARCSRQYIRGAWQSGAMRGYTTSGLGCVYAPVRLNCPPEAALITLESTGNNKSERVS